MLEPHIASTKSLLASNNSSEGSLFEKRKCINHVGSKDYYRRHPHLLRLMGCLPSSSNYSYHRSSILYGDIHSLRMISFASPIKD